MAKSPIHEIRLGLIKAAVWEKRVQGTLRHTVTVTRLFKNGEVWKQSTRFGRDDLPLVAKAAQSAHTWIFRRTHR